MNIEIANRLAELRKEHGYSQEELAAELGVSRQAISKWECGESSPDTDNLIALAKVYNVSLDELLGNPVRPSKEKEEEVTEVEVVDKTENDEDDDDDDDDDDDEDDDEKRNSPKKPLRSRKFHIAIATINGSGYILAGIAYLIMGFLWKGPTGNLGWASGWTLFLLPIILSSLLAAIMGRRIARFSYPLLVVAVYCDMGIIGGAYGINLWHPYWFLFLTIPLFYVIAGIIDRECRR